MKLVYGVNHIADYRNKLSEVQKERIIKHCNRYQIAPIITAWYNGWDDFCSDWCENLNYTKTEARKILHGGRGEFLVFSNGEIIRLQV